MVAAGAVAKKWLLEQRGTTFVGWMSALGEIDIPFEGEEHIRHNAFFAPNASIVNQLEAHMDALRKAGDSCGARITVVAQRGSVHGDALTPSGFASNHGGGVLGGISTGQDLVVRIAIKPTSSIRSPRPSINRAGDATVVETFGRHDPCVGIRATPIAEAMLALVLMDHALRNRAQCGDVVLPIEAIAASSRPRD